MPTTIMLKLRRVRLQLSGVAWRVLILITVFMCGFLALQLGAGFSERAGVADGSVLTQLYYTLGLFVLGGLDLGIPDGGSTFARFLLWFAYFAAPAVTAASLIEGVLRAIAPDRWRLRRLRRHIVIAGCGRLGRLYLKQLRAKRGRKPVVVVELMPDHPAAAEVTDVHEAYFFAGDIRDDAVLDTLSVDRAERVLLLTGDDFVNLDAAAKILARAPAVAKRTVVHVGNLRFLRLMENIRVAKMSEIFNKHQVAASELVDTELLAHFQRTEARDIVVLAGFGRFGQTVLDLLQRDAADKFERVIIIDHDAHHGEAVFGQQIGFNGFYERQIIQGDLRDPRVWQQIDGIRDAEPVFIIGCGDDSANLTTALWVKSEYPNAYVVARNFYRSPFADDVSREGGFHLFSVADLVIDSMPDSWFGKR